EIIVVDNASADGSPEAVEQSFPQVKLIRNNENYGFAKANNQGFKLARGKSILMLNSDTVFIESGMRAMLNHFWSDSTIGILAPRLLNVDASIQNSCRKFFSFFRTNYEPPDRILSRLPDFAGRFLHIHNVHKMTEPSDIDYAIGAALLIKRNVIDKIGGLDEDFFFYGEETDFCLQAHNFGYRVVYYPHFRIIHIRGQSTAEEQSYFGLYHGYKSKYYYLKKNHSYLTYRLFWLRKVFQIFLVMVYNLVRSDFERYRNNKKILGAHFKEF
ncbi:MAG: glycosyltransferase family 2 protein, partial [Deltaproteobacteria bacterium]|nr:glycosyltransferase family 2 protein [Deltaproteobacteria bacterium]